MCRVVRGGPLPPFLSFPWAGPRPAPACRPMRDRRVITRNKNLRLADARRHPRPADRCGHAGARLAHGHAQRRDNAPLNDFLGSASPTHGRKRPRESWAHGQSWAARKAHHGPTHITLARFRPSDPCHSSASMTERRGGVERCKRVRTSCFRRRRTGRSTQRWFRAAEVYAATRDTASAPSPSNVLVSTQRRRGNIR